MIHKKNSFELTEEGKVLFESIQPIFDSVNLSKIKIANQKKEISGIIKVGFSYSMALNVMPSIFQNFKKKYPLVTSTIKLANSTKLAELISNRTVDLGIGMDDPSFYKLNSRSIRKGKFVLVSSKKNPNLEEETFLIGDKGNEVVKFKQFYQKNRMKNHIIEIESWEVINRFVQSGLGVGLIPDFILDSLPNNKFHVVDLGIKFPEYELKCFYRDEIYLAKSTKVFLDYFSSVHQ
jgi:LysR family transcriptional activator of glutamate synthase operon